MGAGWEHGEASLGHSGHVYLADGRAAVACRECVIFGSKVHATNGRPPPSRPDPVQPRPDRPVDRRGAATCQPFVGCGACSFLICLSVTSVLIAIGRFITVYILGMPSILVAILVSLPCSVWWCGPTVAIATPQRNSTAGCDSQIGPQHWCIGCIRARWQWREYGFIVLRLGQRYGRPRFWHSFLARWLA